jgi:hypothetical protein
MSDAWIAAAAVVAATVLTGLLSYYSALRLRRQQARLEWVTTQLAELYGPLNAVFQANKIAHQRLVDTLRPGSTTLFDPGLAPLDDDELERWRMWVIHSAHPRSTRAYEVICAKAHLLIDDDMPACLLEFCAHKAGYDVLVQRWRQGDVRDHLSVVRHPGDALYDYVATSFADLKRTQGELLRLTHRR